MLLNNKLKALMPYTSDFILLPSDYYANEKVGRLSKKRARSKVLEAKSSIFLFWHKCDRRLCKQTWKYVYFELKYFECIHYYFLFLILCSLPTSTGGRGGGEIDDNERLLKTFGVRFLYTVQGKRSSQLSKQRRDRFFPFSTNS